MHLEADLLIYYKGKGCSHLCCDLLHDVNKVVNLPVQLGTLQNHGLHLFDARVHVFICNVTAGVKKAFRSFT